MSGPGQTQQIYSGQVFSGGGAVFQGDQIAARDINIMGMNWTDHFTTIQPFAQSLYRSCGSSIEPFQLFQREIALLLADMETTSHYSKELRIDLTRQSNLQNLMDECHGVLTDFQNLKSHFDGLPTSTQQTWDRIDLGQHSLSNVRIRLIAVTGSLKAFNTQLNNSSQATIEKMLQKFLDEVRTGHREGSVISNQTTESLSTDDKEAWRNVRKELENIGITPALFTQHGPFIITTLRQAVEEGILEERVPEGSSFSSDEIDGIDETQETDENNENNENNEILKTTKASGNPIMPLTKPRPHISTNQKRGGPAINTISRFRRIHMFRRTLHSAIKKNHVEEVRFLLDNGAAIDAVDKYGSTPLWLATELDNVRLVQLLVEKGAAINAGDRNGTTPLYLATELGHVRLVQLLLEKGAAINAVDKKGFTPLNVAMANPDNMILVRLLLEKGAAINAGDENGWTPLHKAAMFGHVGMVQLLLEKGAAVNAVDKLGWTSLHDAVFWHYTNGSLAKLLLEKKIAINAKSSEGRTAFHLLIAKTHINPSPRKVGTAISILQLLLENGAAIDAVASDGETALHHAVRRNSLSAAQLLLEKGADTLVRNNNGVTVWDLALRRDNSAMMDLLTKVQQRPQLLDLHRMKDPRHSSNPNSDE